MCFICIHKIAIIIVENNLEWSFSVYQYIWDVFRKLNSFIKHFSAFPVELGKYSIHSVIVMTFENEGRNVLPVFIYC